MKKVNWVIKFNQKDWLKPYIKMNIELRQKAKNNFQKAFFRKTMENVRKHWDIKIVTTERRRNYLTSGANYHTTKCFTENLSEIEMKKTQIVLNKPVYLGWSILDLSKTVMYQLWYDYCYIQ